MVLLSSHTSMLAISIPATLCRPLAGERSTGLQCVFRMASPAWQRQDGRFCPTPRWTKPRLNGGRLHGRRSWQGLNRVGPEICPLFGLTNLISLINLYYYRRHHIIVLDQVCLSCPPPGPVSNDALHRRGEGIHWPHERST